MKKHLKQLAVLGMAVGLSVASCLTVFATEDTNRLKLFGQELQVYLDNESNKRYVAIVDGADTINISDFATVDSSKNLQMLLGETGYNAYARQPFELKDVAISDIESIVSGYSSNVGYFYMQYIIEYGDAYDIGADVYLFKMPSGYTVESLGDLSKYVIYANGSTNSTQSAEKTASWASNDKGWWIQNSDGTYLTNAWYQSPDSGLWYYMGADGYMLTNTTTPDGHYVNADGAWVQNEENESQSNSAITGSYVFDRVEFCGDVLDGTGYTTILSVKEENDGSITVDGVNYKKVGDHYEAIINEYGFDTLNTITIIDGELNVYAPINEGYNQYFKKQ